MESIKGYVKKNIPLYKSFTGHSGKIVNVCENGLIPYFQKITVGDFNKILSGK